MGLWRELIDFGRDEERDMFEQEVARRTVRVGTLLGGLSGASFAVVYSWSGIPELAHANVWIAVLLLAIAALPVGDAGRQLYAAVTVGMLALGYQLVVLARLEYGVAVWFIVPNIAALILGMRRVAVYCGTVTLAVIVGVVASSAVGVLQPRAVMPHADLVGATSMILVLVVCGLFAFITMRARRQLVRELADRNEALAAALEQASVARNAALEAATSKERFFANLTHEIRTPLNGIAGTAELLSNTLLNAQQQPLAAALRASTANLVDLVNAMLDHAKLSAGHVSLALGPLDLRELAAGVAELFRARAEEKGLRIDLSIDTAVPKWVRSDAMLLKQILANMVSNAVKFTRSGGVTIKLDARPRAPDDLLLSVAVIDTGPGIKTEWLVSIFEPFVQGDPSISRAHGGTGLGLSIARQMAALLGGSLSARNNAGPGATFELLVPIQTAAEPPRPAEVLTRQPAEGIRVLLVEDNAVNRLVAEAMLRSLKAEVCVADNGREAVALADSEEFSVILMDLQMPDVDGIAATREIRRRERLAGRRRVPVLALTGNSPSDYGEACRQSGMDGFLMKPVTVDQFRALLSNLGAQTDTPPERASIGVGSRNSGSGSGD